MTPDPLLERVRAADPAHALGPAPVPGRAAVDAARSRRGRRRAARLVPAGPVLALCGVLVLAPGPGGGPALAQIVDRASSAAEAPAGSIVRISSEVDVRAAGTLHQRRTTWVLEGAGGRPDAVRSLVTEARGQDVAAGTEEVTVRDGRGSTLTAYDPVTGRTRTTQGAAQIPSLVFTARALLAEARRGDRSAVRLGEPVTVDGRRAHRLVVTGAQEPARRGDRDELLIDAETYLPLELRRHSEGTAQDGEPFTYDLVERVVEHEVLPATPANRAQLRLHGPTS